MSKEIPSLTLAMNKVAQGLLEAILSARSGDDCRALGASANILFELLMVINEDLGLEIIHLAGFMEEKLDKLNYTTPKSAVDGQIQVGIETIRSMLRFYNE